MTDGPDTNQDAHAAPQRSPLARLASDPSMGAAEFRAFFVLWDLAGGRPNEIVGSAVWLGSQCGRSARSFQTGLDRLAARGLVEILPPARPGILRLYIMNPNPAAIDPHTAPDPQTLLPLEYAPKPQSQTETGVLTQEPPGVCAPEPPGVLTQEPPTPSGRGPQNTAPNANPAGVCAPKPPPRPIDTKENQSSILPKSQRTTWFNGSNESNEGPGEVCAAVAVAEALGNFQDATTPLVQKRKLEQRIRDVVADPKCARYVAGRAADLVVFHGVALHDLDRILADVAAMRAGGSLKSPGAFFHAKARALAGRHGIDWDTMRKIQEPTS